MQTLKKLLFLLTNHERKQAGLLLVMMILMALLDMIGVASILPFLAVLSNPDVIETNIILNKMFQVSSIFGVENNHQFLFALGILVFITLVISLIFKALTNYAQLRFVQMREYTIGKRLLEGYLHQPYSWFSGRNSADLGKNILSEVGTVIGSGMKPLMDLIAQVMVTIAIIVLLFLTDPKLIITISFFLISTYGLFFYFIRRYLSRIGKERFESNVHRFKTLSEAFGASKEVKVGGLEQTYIKIFSNSAQHFARTLAYAGAINLLPRYFLEALAFGGVLLITLFMMTQSGSLSNSLPVIGLYVFAGYRLMPAVQQIYVSFTKLTFVSPSLNKIYNDTKNLKTFTVNQDQGILSLNKSIILNNVHYNYPKSSRTVLKDINLNITAKTTVGLVGATGSGKTTTVDIILGLLEAQKGTLEIDGQIITKQNSRSWQRSIGYVPQHIYLADDTISANIAFGVPPKDINKESVEKAAKIANLNEFVLDELPYKYQTIIGERGVKLSGGQRQRIGIARALYHKPQVLVFDEATSALDNQTEKAVMDAINNLNKDITIIMIAHRLNTVKKCDKIFLLENGQLKNEGTFEKLMSIDENFRKNSNN